MSRRKRNSKRLAVTPQRSAASQLDSTRLADRTRNWNYYALATGGPTSLRFDRATRQLAQNLCEYEYLNDTTLFGACLKASALTVGVGPTLKILGPFLPYGAEAPADLEKKAEHLEAEWEYYARQTRLWSLIRLIPRELVYHGEIFLRRFPHPQIEEGFRYELVRPERVGNPYEFTTDPAVFDGIRFSADDGSGVPLAYYVRREYVNPVRNSYEYEEVPADEMIHLFTPILPEQWRGVPPFQSGLPKIAQMRQLVKAELTAMTNAAKLGIIFTTSNPDVLAAASDNQQLTGYDGGQTFEIPDGGVFAPPGYEPKTSDPKHPSAQFAEVKRIMASDVGATIGLGNGKINNDHSSYNYSSSKMDAQVDNVVVEVTQDEISANILDVIFNDWLDALANVDPVADEFLLAARIPERVKRSWLWPQPKTLDPLKDAQAEDIQLKNGSITLDEIYSRRRKDAKEELAKWKAERAELARGLEEAGLGYSTSGEITTDNDSLEPADPEDAPEEQLDAEKGEENE